MLRGQSARRGYSPAFRESERRPDAITSQQCTKLDNGMAHFARRNERTRNHYGQTRLPALRRPTFGNRPSTTRAVPFCFSAVAIDYRCVRSRAARSAIARYGSPAPTVSRQ
uniref:Uncharacterized protein n=1 Tax=Plectus sambesii TaxID=2011161 RepID=A0A914V543_9BILA